MRNPVRSESDAFHAAIGFAFLTGISFLLGFLLAPVYGYVLFGAVVVAALVFAGAREPAGVQRLRDAFDAPHPERPPAKHRVLVLANESLAGEELRKEILRRVELWPELYVVAPVLSSRLHYWADDVDRELEEARERLDATLAWAAGEGLDTRGEVGDPDPLTAVEDALRRFGADEILVATHPPGRSNWLEAGVLDRLREALEVRITHVVVDLERDRVEIAPEPLRIGA